MCARAVLLVWSSLRLAGVSHTTICIGTTSHMRTHISTTSHVKFMWLDFSLLDSNWFHPTLLHSTIALLDSALLYWTLLESSWLYLTLPHSPWLYLVLLDSSCLYLTLFDLIWLHHTPPWCMDGIKPWLKYGSITVWHYTVRYSAIQWWSLGEGWGWGVKIEDGIIDPPRRIRLHSSSFCLFRRVRRGGPIHELSGILTTWQPHAGQ